jgi:hypothetical protein
MPSGSIKNASPSEIWRDVCRLFLDHGQQNLNLALYAMRRLSDESELADNHVPILRRAIEDLKVSRLAQQKEIDELLAMCSMLAKSNAPQEKIASIGVTRNISPDERET